MALDATYGPKVYRKQGGDILVVATGGELRMEAGSIITDDGTQAATIADVSVTGTYATDDTPIETAINAIIAALVNAGIVAAA